MIMITDSMGISFLWYWIDVPPAMVKMLISKEIVDGNKYSKKSVLDEVTVTFCWIAGNSSMWM